MCSSSDSTNLGELSCQYLADYFSCRSRLEVGIRQVYGVSHNGTK